MKKRKAIVAMAIYLQTLHYIRNKRAKRKRVRRWQVRPVNRDKTWKGYYNTVFRKLKAMDEEQFMKHTRMTLDLYHMLLGMVEKHLIRPKQRINADERLAITLLHLAQGASIQSIAWSHKLGKSTVRLIILDTCDVLWKVLSPLYMSAPTETQYKDCADDFYKMWNFPNCFGAVDGKHVAIKCPSNSGSEYYNYKKYFSIVLMGVCDANYTFTSVSVGSYGSESDGGKINHLGIQTKTNNSLYTGVFRMSPFGEALIKNELPLPPDTPLPNSISNEPLPYVLVADAAFPLSRRILKPIAPRRSGGMLTLDEKVFNYRLSRARRAIENAFGILTARWRILLTTLDFIPENAEKIVLACVALHNYIMLTNSAFYCPQNYTDTNETNGEWRNELRDNGGPLRSITSHARRSAISALEQRKKFMNYFFNEGAVPFQPTN